MEKLPLAENKKIRGFALVWAEMYKHHKTIPEAYFEDIEFVGDGLKDLGFEMDCGRSLDEAFPSSGALKNTASLKRILDQIDIQTLGNAIYSQWRYFNHWNMAPMDEDDYEWIVVAFSRLAELAVDD